MVSLRSRPICERSCAGALASDWNLTLCSYSHLYVVALVVVAAFAEKSVVNNAVNVELVEEGITILLSLAELPEQNNAATYFGNRCCKNHHFVQFAHTLHELVNARSLDDIDIVVLAFNFHRNREVCLVQNLH